MKLIKQSKLFFKEGNSDKVYEIDLCELAPGSYLVNFRYGKRGSTLKEGTKTPAALDLDKATLLFAELENEKRKKGYQSETEMFMELPSLDAVEPGSAKGAILQRLQDAVSGSSSFKTEWKTSRVIWKAADLQLTEAIPFIIKLATRGDEMQTYASLWALIRLQATQAVPVFNAIAANIKQKFHLRKLAWEGLLSVATPEERSRLSVPLLESLPEEMRAAVSNGDAAVLTLCLQQGASDNHAGYLTFLYLLAGVYPWLLHPLQVTLKTCPYRPPYFRQIRSVYKLAQLRNDAGTLALLSYRFEKEAAMFKRTAALDAGYKNYVHALNQYVRVGSELRNPESKLAFSQFTKTYFQKNAVAFLQDTGKSFDAKTYLKLAVSTLLQYRETDYTPAEERPFSPYGQYNYQTKKYTFTLFSYPECSASLLLSTILFGNDPARKLQPNMKLITGKRMLTSDRYYYSPEHATPVEHTKASPSGNAGGTAPSSGAAAPGSVLDTAVNLFKNFFGKKAGDAPAAGTPGVPAAVKEDTVNIVTGRQELYPEHWDTLPEAYVQLLMEAQMDIIHRFAYNNLQAHPAWEAIIHRFDDDALLLLLNSGFDIPGRLALDALQKRVPEFSTQPAFIGKVLDSGYAPAWAWARQWVDRDAAIYFNDLDFTYLLLLNSRESLGDWIRNLLQQTAFTEERIQAILGKTVAGLLALDNTPANNALATTAIDRLNLVAGARLEQISWNIIGQLIVSPLEANKILAGHILISKSRKAAPEDIPVSLVELFLESEVAAVRKNGMQLLEQYPDSFAAEHIRFVLNQVNSWHPDVATPVLDRVQRLITANPALGNTAVQHLVYVLIRKEKFPGAHKLVSSFITGQLKPYWNSGLQPKDITKLVHAQYRTGQLTGYEILKAYDKPGSFTLGQVISFGNHEILAIRQWCWQYYKQHADRIRYERDKALGLLDATWDDTRAYAFHFFKTEFSETDWDTDTLIGIVDSIRPDVERFGKELITIYFKHEQAEEYLTKLSEHPSVNVQAFVTGYLYLYGVDKPGLLQQLEFYFRSVLTRVNKARVAKDRIYYFLLESALHSEEAAVTVTGIIDDVAAQSAVQDKATCIHILTEIKKHYPHLDMHLALKN